MSPDSLSTTGSSVATRSLISADASSPCLSNADSSAPPLSDEILPLSDFENESNVDDEGDDNKGLNESYDMLASHDFSLVSGHSSKSTPSESSAHDQIERMRLSFPDPLSTTSGATSDSNEPTDDSTDDSASYSLLLDAVDGKVESASTPSPLHPSQTNASKQSLSSTRARVDESVIESWLKNTTREQSMVDQNRQNIEPNYKLKPEQLRIMLDRRQQIFKTNCKLKQEQPRSMVDKSQQTIETENHALKIDTIKPEQEDPSSLDPVWSSVDFMRFLDNQSRLTAKAKKWRMYVNLLGSTAGEQKVIQERLSNLTNVDVCNVTTTKSGNCNRQLVVLVTDRVDAQEPEFESSVDDRTMLRLIRPSANPSPSCSLASISSTTSCITVRPCQPSLDWSRSSKPGQPTTLSLTFPLEKFLGFTNDELMARLEPALVPLPMPAQTRQRREDVLIPVQEESLPGSRAWSHALDILIVVLSLFVLSKLSWWTIRQLCSLLASIVTLASKVSSSHPSRTTLPAATAASTYSSSPQILMSTSNPIQLDIPSTSTTTPLSKPTTVNTCWSNPSACAVSIINNSPSFVKDLILVESKKATKSSDDKMQGAFTQRGKLHEVDPQQSKRSRRRHKAVNIHDNQNLVRHESPPSLRDALGIVGQSVRLNSLASIRGLRKTTRNAIRTARAIKLDRLRNRVGALSLIRHNTLLSKTMGLIRHQLDAISLNKCVPVRQRWWHSTRSTAHCHTKRASRMIRLLRSGGLRWHDMMSAVNRRPHHHDRHQEKSFSSRWPCR
ncbi:hypothetical protein OIO90_004279 [Microbotryomycetes sp. JL221]|nr:hypothetical protein OIO90_004279 [Microbotryomycetes sp. JL221]